MPAATNDDLSTTLTVGDHLARIDLAAGRLASLAVDGTELLVTEGEKITRFGSFPMIPWCGRLPHGRLTWQGEVHEFPLNSPPHANHGVALFQTWERVGSDIVDDTASVVIETPLPAPWPFGGIARQTFTLTPDDCTVVAEVIADDRSMPAMIGWHPWFRRRLDRGGDAELSVEPTQAYATDDEHIPTGELVDVPPPPWDLCVIGVDDPPVITWSGAAPDGGDLRLTVASDLDHWVIFTEPDHALCVEPQSGPPNEFHLGPRVLDAGDSFRATMRLAWSTA